LGAGATKAAGFERGATDYTSDASSGVTDSMWSSPRSERNLLVEVPPSALRSGGARSCTPERVCFENKDVGRRLVLLDAGALADDEARGELDGSESESQGGPPRVEQWREDAPTDSFKK